MTDDEDRSEFNTPDLWVSDNIDGTSGSDFLLTSREERLRAADLLWLNSLLEHEFQSNRNRQAVRIIRAMADIRQIVTTAETRLPDAPILPTHRRRSALWIKSIVAIVVVMGLGVWLQTNPRVNVHAAVSQMQRAALLAEDREYLVTLTFPGLPEEHEVREDRTVNATLFVRGGQAFAVRAVSVLRPGTIWFGRDRDEVWFKPVVGPILSGPSARAMQRRFFANSIEEAPFLQITTIIDRLADQYDLKLLPSEAPVRETLPSLPLCRHIFATLQPSESAPSWLPDLVDIFADPHTGVIMRLVLNWNQGAAFLKRIQFDFVQQVQKPDDWYRGLTVRDSQ